jgi:hypothetical protein
MSHICDKTQKSGVSQICDTPAVKIAFRIVARKNLIARRIAGLLRMFAQVPYRLAGHRTGLATFAHKRARTQRRDVAGLTVPPAQAQWLTRRSRRTGRTPGCRPA